MFKSCSQLCSKAYISKRSYAYSSSKVVISEVDMYIPANNLYIVIQEGYAAGVAPRHQPRTSTLTGFNNILLVLTARVV